MQMSERYAQLVSAYERTVEQRNNLLKERFCTRDLLAAWNESIASTGASLLVHRLALLALLLRQRNLPSPILSHCQLQPRLLSMSMLAVK